MFGGACIGVYHKDRNRGLLLDRRLSLDAKEPNAFAILPLLRTGTSAVKIGRFIVMRHGLGSCIVRTWMVYYGGTLHVQHIVYTAAS